MKEAIFEGRYKVNSNGEIYSLVRNKKIKMLLNERLNEYVASFLLPNSKTILCKVVIIKAFGIDYNPKTQMIEHIDGDNTNLKLENLRVVDRYSRKAKLTPEDRAEIKRLFELGHSAVSLAKKHSVTTMTIYRAVRSAQ